MACARGVAGCGFGLGYEHTSEDHGEELADLVFSCAAGAGRGEGVICTFPRIMRMLCRTWAFLVLLALVVARTLLGVMSLNSRIRLWRPLRWTVWKPKQELLRSQKVVARGRVHHGGTCTAELRRSQQCELIPLSARLHEASFSFHFYTFLWSTDSLDVWIHPLSQSHGQKNLMTKNEEAPTSPLPERPSWT